MTWNNDVFIKFHCIFFLYEIHFYKISSFLMKILRRHFDIFPIKKYAIETIHQDYIVYKFIHMKYTQCKVFPEICSICMQWNVTTFNYLSTCKYCFREPMERCAMRSLHHAKLCLSETKVDKGRKIKCETDFRISCRFET